MKKSVKPRSTQGIWKRRKNSENQDKAAEREKVLEEDDEEGALATVGIELEAAGIMRLFEPAAAREAEDGRTVRVEEGAGVTG